MKIISENKNGRETMTFSFFRGKFFSYFFLFFFYFFFTFFFLVRLSKERGKERMRRAKKKTSVKRRLLVRSFSFFFLPLPFSFRICGDKKFVRLATTTWLL